MLLQCDLTIVLIYWFHCLGMIAFCTCPIKFVFVLQNYSVDLNLSLFAMLRKLNSFCNVVYDGVDKLK